jgi:D-tyrosyl-tRNA(Tyr) deacylase
MDPAKAEPVFNQLVEAVRKQGVQVETGKFGALMQVISTNDGPATFIVRTESKEE